MKSLIIALGLFFLFTGSSTVYACSCSFSTPATALNDAKAVFIGRMLGGTEQLAVVKDANGKDVTIEAGEVRFSIEELFKGDRKGETTIGVASMKGTSCGTYGLKRGERYIVYAYGREKDENILYTGVCTRTTELTSKDAEEDLKFLRNLPAVGTGGNLEGRIWYDSRITSGGGAVSMPNVKVVIRGGDNKEIIVTTNKDGEFEVKKLKAGAYQVEPQLPENFYVEERSRTVVVADRGTATIGFEAYYTGKITGSVIDKKGREYNSIFLHLLSTSTDETQKNVYGHSTGEKGEFDVEGVPPGEYVLFLELQHDDYKSDRNYYYPGTFNRSEAAIIKVGLGGKIEGLKFLLPSEYEVRTIEGQVFGEDGKPVADVEVLLTCPIGLASSKLRIELGAERTKTDKDGKFKLEAFAGETYWLKARNYGEKFSPAIRILVKEDIKNQKLILSENEDFVSCP